MLTELFKTKERTSILRYVMYHDSFRAVDVSTETGVTKGLVSRYLHVLVLRGLVQKSGGMYSPHDCALCRALRLLLNLERIDLLALSLGSASGIGLYGSWAMGTNDQKSDLDFWIKADSLPDQNVLARLQRDLSVQTGSEVNLLMLTPEKLDRIRREDPPFYNSLFFNSVTLKGEPIEEYR